MPESVTRELRVPYMGQVTLLAAVYFVAAKLSLLLAIPPGYATAVWPPSGVALAAVLMLGGRVWPGVWIGAALVNFTIHSSLFAAIVIASGNTLEALACAALIRRFMGVPYRFARGEDVFMFVVLAHGCAAIAASAGLLPLMAVDTLQSTDLFDNWWTWWLGDASGIVIFVPLILGWSVRDTVVWSRPKKVEWACLALLLLTTLWIVFSGEIIFPPFPRTHLMWPFIIWTAFRFSQRETATAIATICIVVVWYTLNGHGPFSAGSLNESLLLLLTYANVLAGIGLVISAIVGERSNAMDQLRAGRDQLETVVQQRTAELERVNRALHEDITARVRIAGQLQASEQRFRLLVDGTDDYAIYMLDTEGRVASWNQAAQKMKGYTQDEIIGRSFACFYTAEESERGLPRRAVEHAAHSGRYEGEGWRVRKDGSVFWANSIITNLRDESGALLGFSIVTRDLSERRLIEEQLRESQAQLRALAIHLQSIREEQQIKIAREIHDELGQALTGLKMDLTWLSNRLQAEQQPLLDKARSMSGLIDDTIHSVRKIASGLRPDVLDELGLASAIGWQAREFQLRTGIRCRTNHPTDMPETDQARSTAVFRIFQELLTNVARHANATRVDVSLRLDEGTLILEVHDNGRGIAAAEMRGPKSLGLLGMQERVLAFNGKIEIVGFPGKGTKAKVSIPLN